MPLIRQLGFLSGENARRCCLVQRPEIDGYVDIGSQESRVRKSPSRPPPARAHRGDDFCPTHAWAYVRRVSQMVRTTTFLIAALALTAPAVAQSCSGCGCKGGPGYRGADGRCVGWANIGKVCGSPPTTHCEAEGPNAGASEAAE